MQTRLLPIGVSFGKIQGQPKSILSMFISTKKTFTLLCTLLLAVVFLGTSCKKDDEKTLDELISAHDWKVTGQKTGGTAEAVEPCTLDDIITFHEDGEYHFDEGASKCNESDLQETMGTWSISESTDPATLSINYVEAGSTITLEWDILELSDKKLVVFVDNIPILGSLEVTYEKK